MGASTGYTPDHRKSQKLTVEYEHPRTGKLTKKRVRGVFDQVWDDWDDLRQGKLRGVSFGWQ